MRQLPLNVKAYAFLGTGGGGASPGSGSLQLEGTGGGGGTVTWLLLEDGSSLLLEGGGLVLLEGSPPASPGTAGGFILLEDGGEILLEGPLPAPATPGAGMAYIGPLSPGESWSGLTAAVSVATNVQEATCSIYAGAAPTPGYLADTTTWGSTGASTTNLPVVKVGGNIWAVWTGGDPGSRATLAITGTRTVR